MSTTLHKIAQIVIGETYHISQNGEFCLVSHTKDDAYGTPIWEIVPLEKWCNNDGVQSLINEIGSAHQTINNLKEELSRTHTALQREAGGPESSTSKPRQREVREARETREKPIITGILEPTDQRKEEL